MPRIEPLPKALLAIAFAVAIGGCSSGSTDGTSGSAPTTGAASSTSTATSTTSAPSTTTSSSTTTTTSTPISTTTTSTTTTSSTTTSTTSTTAVPEAEVADSGRPVIDIAATSLSGLDADAEEVVAGLAVEFGEADEDSGWLAMPPQLACTGNLDYRSLQWDDLRIVLERATADADPSVTGWSLGLANIPLVPGRLSDWSATTGITTVDGIGIGDPGSALLASGAANVQRLDPSTLTASGTQVIRIETDADDEIVGFGSGRNDCIGLDISGLPCDRPIPIPRLPDGSASGEVVIEADLARWGTEQGPDSANIVQETIGGARDADLVELARSAPISAQNGALDVRLFPIGDPFGQAQVYVFDERTECVRQLFVGPGLSEDVWEDYVEILATDLDPQL